jgi:hypothetical protein
MINEGQVTLLWQKMFSQQAITTENLDRAEQLLGELRPESPLRFRLEKELAEISKIHASHQTTPKNIRKGKPKHVQQK